MQTPTGPMSTKYEDFRNSHALPQVQVIAESDRHASVPETLGSRAFGQQQHGPTGERDTVRFKQTQPVGGADLPGFDEWRRPARGKSKSGDDGARPAQFNSRPAPPVPGTSLRRHADDADFAESSLTQAGYVQVPQTAQTLPAGHDRARRKCLPRRRRVWPRSGRASVDQVLTWIIRLQRRSRR